VSERQVPRMTRHTSRQLSAPLSRPCPRRYNLVLGLFGEDAPESVATFKALVQGASCVRPLSHHCDIGAEAVLQLRTPSGYTSRRMRKIDVSAYTGLQEN